MKQRYKNIRFNAANSRLIDQMNDIVGELQRQGYTLTVRQLYYQLVSRDIIPNTLQSYKRMAGLVNDARLAGCMDWSAIEDRTREFVRRSRWGSGAELLRSAAEQFHMDMWLDQPARVFVIIEKEALAGVFEGICKSLDVPLLAARGYPSVSVVREFVQTDVIPALEAGQEVAILHFGDHDPSGLDMTRDLDERIALFADENVNLERCALNMEQIEEFEPPPNPAKTTDSRFAAYKRDHSEESWELDALKPAYLNELVEQKVMAFVDADLWGDRKAEIEKIRAKLLKAAKGFE